MKAPIVRVGEDGGRQLEMLRWSIPRTAAVRRRAGHQYPEPEKPALVAMARPGEPLPRAGNIILRMDRFQPEGDALVCVHCGNRGVVGC